MAAYLNIVASGISQYWAQLHNQLLGIMKISLAPSQMYGHWTHCDPKVCEFQHGSTMIYVSYNENNSMESRLNVASNTIEAAFEEVDDVLVFANTISAERNPEFWKNASRISLKQNPLIVFSIRYPIGCDVPIYEISWNPVFEAESGVALSDDFEEEVIRIEGLPDTGEYINIKRISTKQYEQVA